MQLGEVFDDPAWGRFFSDLEAVEIDQVEGGYFIVAGYFGGFQEEVAEVEVAVV